MLSFWVGVVRVKRGNCPIMIPTYKSMSILANHFIAGFTQLTGLDSFIAVMDNGIPMKVIDEQLSITHFV